MNVCAYVLWSRGRRGDVGSVSVSGAGGESGGEERIGRATESESGRF